MGTSHGGKNPSCCGLLCLFYRRRRVSSPTGSIQRRKGVPSFIPAKALHPHSGSRLSKTRENPSQIVLRSSPKPVSPPVLTPGGGLSGELESMVFDFQKAKESNNLVRASSGNVMVYGNLGNIRGRQGSMNSSLKPPARENKKTSPGHGNESNTATGNGALSKRNDPEELKKNGNEEYIKGRFAEALEFYNRAIALNPEKASYRSNKAAALVGLGRLLEAVGEYKEALRINPSYSRAHHRLAALYLSLGEAEKAANHYKLSGNEADPNETTMAKNLKSCILRCSKARKQRDWQTMLRECESAISMGAYSSPKVFCSKAEALLKLGNHADADLVMSNAPKLDTDAVTSFFGAITNGYILMVQAQVHMASGRFNEAIAAAQRAAQLDRSNKEISIMVRRTRAVAAARNRGNELFKASKYAEACMAYREGLDHDQQNAVLLCNRAACHSKLGQWGKAVDECSTALSLRPSYTKARMRRADCYAKLEKWEEAAKDYEILVRELPGDEDLMKGLSEAKSQLHKNYLGS